MIRLTLIIFVSFMGCAKNPVAPKTEKGSFDSFSARMDTPSKISRWLANISYRDATSQYLEGVQKHSGDIIEREARYVFAKSRATCSGYTAIYVCCLRAHGYNCGTVFSAYDNLSHAQAWIEEGNKTISITENAAYKKSVYADWEKMMGSYKNRKTGYYVFRDSKNKLIDCF